MSERKTQVCIPTRGLMDDGFVSNLLDLYMHHAKQGEFLAPILRGRGGTIHSLRQMLVEGSFATGASEILWIDDDMWFPPNTLERLRKHGKPFVACNYLIRHTAHRWTARKESKSISSTRRSGLQKMDMAALGVALVQLSVYEGIPIPWFDTFSRVQSGKVEYLNEDVVHASKLRNAGIDLWIDHDLSQEVAHTLGVKGSPKGVFCANTGTEWLKL